MFDIIFGAAHAIYIAGALVGSVILWPDQTYPLHKAPEEREMVEVVGFHPQWYKADSKCHYSGLRVPLCVRCAGLPSCSPEHCRRVNHLAGSIDDLFENVQ